MVDTLKLKQQDLHAW